jgi:hypothetical protein
VDTVALAATIGGSLVGLAGVGASAWSSWVSRKSALELAASQQQHERELARGTRLFDRRAPVYGEMVELLYRWLDRVNATEPIMRFADEPDPVGLPSEEEALKLQARFGTVSSPATFAAFGEAIDALQEFTNHVRVLRTVRQHGGELARELEAVQEARETVRAAVPDFQRVVSDELEGL